MSCDGSPGGGWFFTRMGFDKLSFDLGGETVLERSVRAFDECPEVDELVIVTGARPVRMPSGLLPAAKSRCGW